MDANKKKRWNVSKLTKNGRATKLLKRKYQSICLYIFFFFSVYFCPFIAEFALQEITLLLLKRCLHSAPIFFKIMYAITVCAHKFLHNLFVQLVAFYCDEIFFLFFITQRMRRFFCVLSRFNGMLKKSLIFARTFNANTSLWVHNVQCTVYTLYNVNK